MGFGKILQALRLRAGLSQGQLAEKAGVPVRTIQGWERGARSPVSDQFFKVARALGAAADEFSAVADPEKPARKKAGRKPNR